MPTFGRGMSLVTGPPASAPADHLPSGAKAQTCTRGTVFTNLSILVSGKLSMFAIDLQAGTIVTSGTFMSCTTALSGGTNQWFALYSSAFGLLRQTSDDTNTAWGSNAAKTLNFTTPYTVPTTATYYLGCMVAAATCPTLLGPNIGVAASTPAPVLAYNADTGLTTTAPSTAGSLVIIGTEAWAYVS